MDPVYKNQDGSSVAPNSSAPAFYDTTASPASPPEPQHHRRCTTETPNKNKTKSRVKSSSRRLFLDKNVDEEGAGDAEESDVECESETKEQDSVAAVAPRSTELNNSWTRPLTLDELSPSDAETENCSGDNPNNQSSETRVQSKHCSGMILKLRKMLGGGLNRKKACYEAVSESGTVGESSLSPSDVGEGGSSKKSLQDTPPVTRQWKRKMSFSRPFRPLGSSSKPKHRSLLNIKYCPYLSACHSAEHRRRWVLRSAVQRARRAMRFYYPDLVGKRIRHLYEEDDKSEVWYRGEVLCVHEAHANPLKTIFEVRYDSEPEWKYYLELLIDYKKGWLKIED